MKKSEWLKELVASLPGLSKTTLDLLKRNPSLQECTVEQILPMLTKYQAYRGFGTKAAKEIGIALHKAGFDQSDSEFFTKFTLEGRISRLRKAYRLSKKDAILAHRVMRAEGLITEPLF